MKKDNQLLTNWHHFLETTRDFTGNVLEGMTGEAYGASKQIFN